MQLCTVLTISHFEANTSVLHVFSSSRNDATAIKVVADSINGCPTRRFKRRLQDVARTDRLKQRHLADFSAENQGLSVGGNVRRGIPRQ